MKTTLSFGHPRGLPILFFAELWERYGFYTMQALLVMFLIKHLHFNDVHAYAVFGAYSSLLYITPVIGGYLADRVLGFRRSIFLGGFICIVGYFSLMILSNHNFYFGLACLIAGNGFFKSSVSSLLGALYKEGDPRRDIANSI